MSYFSVARLSAWPTFALTAALVAGCGGGGGGGGSSSPPSPIALDDPAVLALLQAADGELVPRGNSRVSGELLSWAGVSLAVASTAATGSVSCPGGGTLTTTRAGGVSEHVFNNCFYFAMDPSIVNLRFDGAMRLTELTGGYDDNSRVEATDLEARINYGGGGFEAFVYNLDATLGNGPGAYNSRTEIPLATIRHFGEPPPNPVPFDLTVVLTNVDSLVLPDADILFRYSGTFAAVGTDNEGEAIDVSASFSTIQDILYLEPAGDVPNFPYSGVTQVVSSDGLTVRIRFGTGEVFIQINDEGEQRLSHAEFLALVDG